MDKPRTTPKDFFLWAGAMISLYWSVVAFIFLVFDYINYAMPNPLAYYPADPYQSSIPYDMASIIVLFPVYLVLIRLINRDIVRDPSRAEIWVRRWAILLTLFVAGATAAIDLIVLLTTFLRGEEITLAFLLKVLLVLLVSAAAFMHFIADLWGYWAQFPARRNMVGAGAGIVAIAAIVAGFFIVGTPQQARLYRFDEQKVTDLQEMQYQIINYYQRKQALPQTLADLTDSISGYSAPQDPQTGSSYEYKPTGKLTFSLCAVFNETSRGGNGEGRNSSPVPVGAYRQDNWQHAKGHACFDRTIDPQLYPPIQTQPKGL